MTARVIDFARAKRLSMGGIVNVGKASQHKPCLVILEHNPRAAAKASTLWSRLTTTTCATSEQREQRRMNVHDPAIVTRRHAEFAQKAGADHQVRL